MNPEEEKKQIHDWCNTCKHIRVDADYCMACVDKSLEGVFVVKPKGYKEVKEGEIDRPRS